MSKKIRIWNARIAHLTLPDGFIYKEYEFTDFSELKDIIERAESFNAIHHVTLKFFWVSKKTNERVERE